ncbi:MAG: GTPase domain-containing protein [Oligoflexia bacterium]|nr:GTPase domain-containing protein [Oligoflexia bacterium]
MSLININSKEIHCKILYYGPEGSGKKTSLLYIKKTFNKTNLDFIQLSFKKEIYALILFIGKIFSFKTYFHIYNLNNESKKENEILLRGTDGIVFVASSKPEDRQKNRDSFTEMEELLNKQGKNLFQLPLVLQYNKSDLSRLQPLKQMKLDLNKYNNKDFKSSSLTGDFILEPLRHLCKLSLIQLKKSNL